MGRANWSQKRDGVMRRLFAKIQANDASGTEVQNFLSTVGAEYGDADNLMVRQGLLILIKHYPLVAAEAWAKLFEMHPSVAELQGLVQSASTERVKFQAATLLLAQPEGVDIASLFLVFRYACFFRDHEEWRDNISLIVAR